MGGRLSTRPVGKWAQLLGVREREISVEGFYKGYMRVLSGIYNGSRV